MHFCLESCCGSKWRCLGRTPWRSMGKEIFSGWIRLALALPLPTPTRAKAARFGGPVSRGRSGFAHHDSEEAVISK